MHASTMFYKASVALTYTGVLCALSACSADQTTASRRSSRAGNGAMSGSTGGSGDPTGPNPTTPGVGGTGGRRNTAGKPKPGDCGAACYSNPTGAGTDTPFDVTDNPSGGVGLDPDGALVLQTPEGAGSNYIWIANTVENTLSKINVETYVEEARYMIATGETAPDGNVYGFDPSRTSVNLEGDAFVGSRMGHGLTRISALGKDCPDTNGDGAITTSSGAMDVLPYGQDDCVLWFTKLEGTIRGVAAQDIPGTTHVEIVPDKDPIITTTPGEHYVWVGNTEKQLWKIDAKTGDILIATSAPTEVYGLAMNGQGILYMTGGGVADDFGWVDTAKCVDAASCGAAACTAECTPASCPAPDTCKDATAVAMTLSTPGGGTPYGITVDCKQRVWLGALGGDHAIRRFDPTLPDAKRLAFGDPITKNTHGIGADRNGFVWGAQPDSGLVRIDAETLGAVQIPLAAPAKGIGIDRFGKIWGVAQGPMTQVVQPGVAIADNPVVGMVQGLGNPYTYSDMTGEQLRLATNEPGHYRTVFEGCGGAGGGEPGPTEWGELTWDAETPKGTVVVFVARTAETLDELDAADWFNVAALPGRDSPVDVAPYAAGASQTFGHYFEIEVRLITNDTGAAGDRCSDGADLITPRVKSFSVAYRCKQTPG